MNLRGSSCESKVKALDCAKGTYNGGDMIPAGKGRIIFRLWCILSFLAAALCMGTGCNKTREAARESGSPPQTHHTTNEHPGVPSCSFDVDSDGSLIVDLGKCRTLEDDSTCVVLTGSSLGRPIFLAHLSDQIYYALDSRCRDGQCTARVSEQSVFCPCDSSRYDFTGAVTRGPAVQPLRELPSLKNGDRIRITTK